MGLNNKPPTSCHCPLLLANGSYALALGRDTKPGHHGLVRPDSRRENLIFYTIHNFIHALKIALDSEPRGRRYAKNTGHDRNPPKLSVGAHFELSFLGCGFLIHFLSRGSESRAVGPVGKMNKKTTP